MPLADLDSRPLGTPRSERARQIVDAAFAILDAEGSGGLTMRGLADDLGMRAPSLYKHFADKAHVEAALIEDMLFAIGDALHLAVARPGRAGVLRSLLGAYRRQCLAHPNRYRLATSGPLRRDLLPADLEDWAGRPFYLATREPHRAQALWSLAHGMVILEIDGRYPSGSDLDRTWRAAASAFATPQPVGLS